jgi:hypothetical protein
MLGGRLSRYQFGAGEVINQGGTKLTKNPIIGFQVNPSDIQFIGEELQRPECILAEPDGTLWAADGALEIKIERCRNIPRVQFQLDDDATT